MTEGARFRILEGDCLDVLATLDTASVQTCISSPPYWGLRDYGTATWESGDADCEHAPAVASRATYPAGGLRGGTATVDAGTIQRGDCRCGARRIDSQLGLEPTPEQYVANLVGVFREVKRVLRDDGTLWLNLGDSYAGSWGNQGLKPKDLVGIPWMVAFALRADGWYLRSDIIWAKPNSMPESVTDRPTKAHEYLFLLSKQPRYFYDADAIREDLVKGAAGSTFTSGRNKRSVWRVSTQSFHGAHFATFPPKMIEPCVLAGSPPKCCGECGAPWVRVVERKAMVVKPSPKREAWQALDDHARTQVGGTVVEPSAFKTVGWRSTCAHDDDSGHALVLDPFAGSGTTGVVALRHNRSFVGIELNSEYAQMARNRIYDDAPLLNVEAE